MVFGCVYFSVTCACVLERERERVEVEHSLHTRTPIYTPALRKRARERERVAVREYISIRELLSLSLSLSLLLISLSFPSQYYCYTKSSVFVSCLVSFSSISIFQVLLFDCVFRKKEKNSTHTYTNAHITREGIIMIRQLPVSGRIGKLQFCFFLLLLYD